MILAFANLDIAGLCAMAILVGFTLPDGARDKRSARRRARYRYRRGGQVIGAQTERGLVARLAVVACGLLNDGLTIRPRSVCAQAVRLDESGGSMSSGNGGSCSILPSAAALVEPVGSPVASVRVTHIEGLTASRVTAHPVCVPTPTYRQGTARKSHGGRRGPSQGGHVR